MSLLQQFEDRKDNPPEDLATQIVFTVLDDLNGRDGYDSQWDECDDEIQEEILTELVEKVQPLVE